MIKKEKHVGCLEGVSEYRSKSRELFIFKMAKWNVVSQILWKTHYRVSSPMISMRAPIYPITAISTVDSKRTSTMFDRFWLPVILLAVIKSWISLNSFEKLFGYFQ